MSIMYKRLCHIDTQSLGLQGTIISGLYTYGAVIKYLGGGG